MLLLLHMELSKLGSLVRVLVIRVPYFTGDPKGP